jgi:hypothetical protein
MAIRVTIPHGHARLGGRRLKLFIQNYVFRPHSATDFHGDPATDSMFWIA